MKEPVIRSVWRGRILYRSNGFRHREHGPSYISPNGYMEYTSDGQAYREDGPVSIYPDGTMYYYKNGKFVKDMKA